MFSYLDIYFKFFLGFEPKNAKTLRCPFKEKE